MYCSRCGGEIPIGSKCPDCGIKQKRPSFIWPFLAIVLFIFSAGVSYWSYNEINALKLSAEMQVAEAHGKGYAEGEIQGHKAGYEEAYALAYDEGYTAGTNDTYDAAYQAGYDEGSAAGYKDGRDFGYNSGFSAGEIEGYKIGSGKEYKASDYYVAKAKYEEAKSASNTGNQPTTYETLKQMAEAATSGKNTVLSPSQFQELYDAGRDAGLSPGETIDALSTASDVDYDTAYDLGFADGREAGYNAGKNTGYNQGYQAGLEEGFEVGSGKEYNSLEFFLMQNMSAQDTKDENYWSRMIQLALADNSNNHPKQNSK